MSKRVYVAGSTKDTERVNVVQRWCLDQGAQCHCEGGVIKPTDICIVLCSFPAAHEDGWIDSANVAYRLNRLGFNVTSQQAAAALNRMARMDAPPVEVGDHWSYKTYRVTPYGETWVHNKLPDIWWAQQTSRDRMRQRMGVTP